MINACFCRDFFFLKLHWKPFISAFPIKISRHFISRWQIKKIGILLQGKSGKYCISNVISSIIAYNFLLSSKWDFRLHSFFINWRSLNVRKKIRAPLMPFGFDFKDILYIVPKTPRYKVFMFQKHRIIKCLCYKKPRY